MTPGNSGQALVQLTPIPKAKSYEIQSAPMVNGVPGTWTTTTVTAAKRPLTIWPVPVTQEEQAKRKITFLRERRPPTFHAILELQRALSVQCPIQ